MILLLCPWVLVFWGDSVPLLVFTKHFLLAWEVLLCTQRCGIDKLVHGIQRKQDLESGSPSSVVAGCAMQATALSLPGPPVLCQMGTYPTHRSVGRAE